jgi:hypothetical protein
MSFTQVIRPSPRPFVTFCNKLFLYGEELLATPPTPKLEDHPLTAVHNCFFCIFGATLHIWRLSLPYTAWWRAMLWWQWIRLTWLKILQQRKSYEELEGVYGCNKILQHIFRVQNKVQELILCPTCITLYWGLNINLWSQSLDISLSQN